MPNLKNNWDIVASILDDIQSFVITEQSPTATKVIEKAAQLIAASYKDFSILNLQFSIVYQPYHFNTLNVFLERGNVITKPFSLEQSKLSQYQDNIKKVVATGLVDSCPTGKYKYLIVPMRLDPKAKAKDGQVLPPRRVIGAFLLESNADYAFQEKNENLEILFDHFSDRVAVLIQLGEYKTRPQVTRKLHSDYLGSIGKFKSELQIFEKLIDSLTKNESDYCYADHEITVLLYHPFYADQLYFVCEDGTLNRNFRSGNSYSINSNKIFNLFGENASAIFSKLDNKVTQFELGDYCSNIVVPILVHNHNKIGYLVLRTQQANVYRNEKNLLKRTADILAATLRSFRHDRWELQLSTFLKEYIYNNKSREDKELYEAVIKVLEDIYGTVEFAVVELSQEDRTPDFIFRHNCANWSEVILLEEINSCMNELNLKPFHDKSNQYYIYNISAESGRITNFVIIKMTRESATATHNFIQQLLAMVGNKQSFMRKKRRLTALTEFCTEITNKQNITLNKAYDLAYKYTRKVMAAPNMYIALLNKQTQEIIFPLFKIKDEETGEIKDSPVKPRIFDRTAKSIPRTEYILANPIKNNKDKEPTVLIIYTKDQSIQWYKDNGDSEKLGNPFASWIGVPIMNAGEAIGVIVVYHPTAEYVYNEEGDGVFLKNIAAHFSSLMVRVTLKEQNEKLKESIEDNAELKVLNKELEVLKNKLQEANNNIIVKEGQLIRESLAQDLAHRWKNSISGIQARASESIYFLNKYSQPPQKPINDLYAIINEAKKILSQMTFSPETMPERENVDIYKLIKDIVDNLESEYDISELSIVRIESIGSSNDLYTYKSLLEICLFSVTQNAFKAVRKKIDSSTNSKFYILIRVQSEDGRVIIEIEDNGEPIPENLRDTVFSLGVKDNDTNSSGYGLYRAKQVFELIGGSIEFTKGLTKPYDVKKVHIEIPNLIKRIRTAVIIEDQEIWLDPLASWLAQEGFETKKASTYEDAISLCKFDYKKDDLFVIDIALNEKSSINRDGLKIVNLLRKKSVYPKIVLFTSYHNAAEFYKNRVDLIIRKSEGGNAISQQIFIEKINELYKDE